MARSTEQLLARLQELSALEAGWYDGEGLPPSPLVLDRAQSLARCVKHWNPSIFANRDGGIEFEWYAGRWVCNITLLNTGRTTYVSVQADTDDCFDLSSRTMSVSQWVKLIEFEHSQERA